MIPQVVICILFLVQDCSETLSHRFRRRGRHVGGLVEYRSASGFPNDAVRAAYKLGPRAARMLSDGLGGHGQGIKLRSFLLSAFRAAALHVKVAALKASGTKRYKHVLGDSCQSTMVRCILRKEKQRRAGAAARKQTQFSAHSRRKRR